MSTQHDNHQVAEADEGRHDGRIVGERRGLLFRVNGVDVLVFVGFLVAEGCEGSVCGCRGGRPGNGTRGESCEWPKGVGAVGDGSGETGGGRAVEGGGFLGGHFVGGQ